MKIPHAIIKSSATGQELMIDGHGIRKSAPLLLGSYDPQSMSNDPY